MRLTLDIHIYIFVRSANYVLNYGQEREMSQEDTCRCVLSVGRMILGDPNRPRMGGVPRVSGAWAETGRWLWVTGEDGEDSRMVHGP